MKLFKIALTSIALLGSTPLLAHTPLCACFDNGDGTITCEGGFSDGSSAAGVELLVMNSDDKVILKGALNESSELEFDKPAGKYSVMFNAGPGHEIIINSDDITE